MKDFNLVFFRHGIAAPTGIETTTDRDRPLTKEGIRKTQGAAEGLKTMNIAIDRIFTSPWLRAMQTAVILSEVLMLRPAESLLELAGDRTVDELLGALGAFRGQTLLLVGHQPLLGETVAHLLGAREQCRIELRKSGACALRVDAIPRRKPAVLQWLLTSKQLRQQAVHE